MTRRRPSLRPGGLPGHFCCVTISLIILAAFVGAAHSESGESIIRDPSPGAITWFAQNCVLLRDLYVEGPDIRRSCSVNEFGPMTAIETTRLYFALYRRLVTIGSDMPSLILDRPPFQNTAIVIFEAASDSDRIRPILAHINEGTLGGSWFERPLIIPTPHGLLLRIPNRIGGTAAENEDFYYRWSDSRWHLLETQSWREDLAKRLPIGFGVWKGIVPDLDRMKAGSAVWRDGDANCCPTGGSVCVELAYRGDTLVIDMLRHDPKTDTGVCGQ